MPTNRHTDRAAVEIYANALVAAVKDGGAQTLLDIRSQMDAIVAYNRSHLDLVKVLGDEARSGEERADLVRKTFADCNPALVSVLGVMAERGTLVDTLPKVRLAFPRLVTDELGITVVDVKTRVPLDDHLREVIKNKAAADFGGTIVLSETVDPQMLGGIVMSANGKLIDASVDSLVERARNVLKS